MFWPVKLFGVMQETTVCYLSFVLVPGSMYGLSIEQNHFRTEAFSTISGSILLQARDPAKLNEDIQIAVDHHRCDESWRYVEQHMQMEGFPRKSVVNNVLVCFAESLDSHWLQKGYSLVEQAFEESKQNLLEKEPLVYLSLALAKSGMAVPASTILRKLVETEEYPHVSAWSVVFAHMSFAGSGSYLLLD